MSRFVSPKLVLPDGALVGAEDKDDFKDRLERIAKYVPGEILALFLFLNGIAANAKTDSRMLWWYGVSYVICQVLTPIYFLWIIGEGEETRGYQAVVSTISFFVWAYALGAGFLFKMPWYDPIAAAFGVGIWSTISAWLRPKRTIAPAGPHPNPAPPAPPAQPQGI